MVLFNWWVLSFWTYYSDVEPKEMILLYFLSYFVVFFVLLPGIFSQLYLPTFHIRLTLCASFLSFSIFEGISLPTYYTLQNLLLLLTLKILSQELLLGFLIILFHGMLFCFCVVIISQFFLSILKIHFKKSIFWIFCFLFVYVWLSCCWVFSYSWWFMIDIPI